jgi:fatty-acyl-CoA synthase
METIADLAGIEALERIPLQERDLPGSNYESIRAVAAELPDHPALHFVFDAAAYDRSFSYTYADLVGSITRTANMLNGLGLGHDEVVSIVLPNLPQTYFAFLGGEAAGIANPINPLLEPETMAEIMNAAGTKVLVTLGPFPLVDIWEKLESISNQVPSLETVLQVDLGRFVTGLEEGAVGPARTTERPANVRASVLDFDSTAAGYPDDKLSSGRDIRPDEIASYFHTGGTTGTPKLAQHTYFNEVYDAWAAAQNIAPGPDTVMFCGLPLFHVNGVTVTGLLPWGRGSTVVLGTPQGYRNTGVIQNFWKMVEHYRINFFSGVPTVYGSLLDVPLGDSDVGSLEFALCGAAPMPAEVFREFEQRTGVRILEGYGLTEGACVSSMNPAHGERRVGSIGLRLPYEEMRTAVLQGNGGFARFCEPEEIGTLIVRGPNVFPGYKEEVHNLAAFVETGDGRWLNTGDLGRQDADGYFWLTGRKKEIIIRGGHNIDPKLIEDPLHRHEAVALVAAVGRPDARLGEVPVAYVQLAKEATEDELLSYARDAIGERAAVPKAVRVVDRMPVTDVGKIFKPRLVQRELEDAYGQELAAIAGVHEARVQAVPDKSYGTLARVRVKADPGYPKEALEEEIVGVLGRYATAYELDLE